MTTWYYSQNNQAVGPFEPEMLGKLVHAGVIDRATLIRKSGEEAWQPLANALATHPPAATAAVPIPEEPHCYYYLDAADQPVGPFDTATLRRLYGERVIRADTLVSGIGDQEWLPVSRVLQLPGTASILPARTDGAARGDVYPCHRSFEQFVLRMGVTLTFYTFFLVPCQSRDLKAVTGRERLEFRVLLVLGIVTLGVALLVMQVLWAYDLERHGQATSQAGRRASLGTQVLGLVLLGFLFCCGIDSFFVGTLVASLFNGAALWLLQREINLYVGAPNPAAVA